MKYIVYWCIVTFIDYPCPSYKTVDEFGRESWFQSGAMCGRDEYDCGYKKEFNNSQEAHSFYNRALKEETGFWNGNEGRLDSVKIDSVKIK